MIVAASFHTYGFHDILIIDTKSLNKKFKKMFEAKKSGIDGKYQYNKNTISVEKYDYGSILKEAKKAEVTPEFPLSIDKKITVHEYDEMDGVMDSW